MRNVSLKGEDISVKAGLYYYVIDALFLSEISERFSELDLMNIDQEIETKIFPFMDAPFAKILIPTKIFSLDFIHKVSYDDIDFNQKVNFSSDTGLIILLEESLLVTFIKKNYHFDDLVDSLTEDVNIEYWKKLTSSLPLGEYGLILAPGVGSGFDFEGSGIYQIKQNI